MLAAERKTDSFEESNGPLVVSFGVGYYHSHLVLPEPLFQSLVKAEAQVRPVERRIHSYPTHIPVFFPGSAFFLNGGSQNEANYFSCCISYQTIIGVGSEVVGYFIGIPGTVKNGEFFTGEKSLPQVVNGSNVIYLHLPDIHFRFLSDIALPQKIMSNRSPVSQWPDASLITCYLFAGLTISTDGLAYRATR
jgi:hypothetical protein